MNDGYSGCRISKILGLNRSTVLKFIKRFKGTGSPENLRRSGRPKKTDDRGDRQILRIVKSNRRKCLNDIIALYNEQTPVKLSKETVKRRLKFYGYKRRVVKKKIVISKINRLRRRAWCRTKLHLTVENFWKNVIFTDETQTVLGKDLRNYIWRKDDEKWAPRCLGEHVDIEPRVKANVMFWGCITYSRSWKISASEWKHKLTKVYRYSWG